ncbi:MAG: pantoate--beta-alanine ligase [Methylococcaceae bacterium]|jgi:pantoate--beta-alanine ligase
MQIVKPIDELRATIKVWRQAGNKIALVPTMGNLHHGHLKLVDAAKKIADKVVVSIFVNPLQFAAGEDYHSYPRTESQDQQLLQAAGVDLLFLPTVAEVYPYENKTSVLVCGLSELYCGAFRPGHFAGVATIVCKLFNMVCPDLALFGLKDFQQLAIIKTMVRDLDLPVELVAIDTVREASGLAMSSRNGYLSDQEKILAPKLYEVLCTIHTAIRQGERNYRMLEQQAIHWLEAHGFKCDYFSICRIDNLGLAEAEDKNLVLLSAAKLGKTRLIDNIIIEL